MFGLASNLDPLQSSVSPASKDTADFSVLKKQVLASLLFEQMWMHQISFFSCFIFFNKNLSFHFFVF